MMENGEPHKINPGHEKPRNFMRTVGPILLLIGGGFMITGFVDFFSAFGSFGKQPELFWCFFVGMPFIFIGTIMTKMGYLGKVARYTSQELAPVGKDTFNYMANETKEGITDMSEAFFEGMSKGLRNDDEEEEDDRKESLTIEERIKKLETLKEKGIINEEDFEEQKDRILSEI